MGDKTKTYAGIRELKLNEVTKKLLQQCLDKYIPNPEHLIFYDHVHQDYITTNQVNMVFKRFWQKHNIGKGYDVNQHMLRHTFATRCIESDMPPKVIQKILGHADISTTPNTYCDVFAEYESKYVDNSLNYLKEQGLL